MKKLFYVAILILLIGIVLPFRAQAAVDYGSQFFTNVSLENVSGKESSEFRKTDKVKVVYDFKVNQQVHTGDQMTIALPEQLTMVSYAPFQLKDSEGNVVALAETNSTTGMITLTFTNFVETHQNIQGSMFFWAKFNVEKIQLGSENQLTFPVQNEAVVKSVLVKDTTSGGSSEGTSVIYKQGRIDTKQPDRINWTVTVNNALLDIENGYVIDTIGPGHELINPVQVRYRDENKKVVATYTQTVNVQNRAFRIDVGSLSKQSVVITYQTKVNGGQTSYKNNATLYGDNIKIYSRNSTVNDYSNGGKGGGEATPPPTSTPEPKPEVTPTPNMEETTTEPPTTTVEKNGEKIYYYEVKKGDTLKSIATSFKTTPKQLMMWNNLPSENVYVGQKLIVRIENQTTISLPHTGDSAGLLISLSGLLMLGTGGLLLRRK
ncbi:LysM peptidoglycan-binding domain-containing protein [Listeria sp. ILCC797]|uniref:LysM peptidoglycan-binding domain-containing protein n=1 Tax=Listeria sp. ILCC797 TaxID=1918333 RepID=UPI000B594389|nr:LysM peptidoglycan-binding domain-containing protein [Listeria sp. ILCC797]